MQPFLCFVPSQAVASARCLSRRAINLVVCWEAFVIPDLSGTTGSNVGVICAAFVGASSLIGVAIFHLPPVPDKFRGRFVLWSREW